MTTIKQTTQTINKSSSIRFKSQMMCCWLCLSMQLSVSQKLSHSAPAAFWICRLQENNNLPLYDLSVNHMYDPLGLIISGCSVNKQAQLTESSSRELENNRRLVESAVVRFPLFNLKGMCFRYASFLFPEACWHGFSHDLPASSAAVNNLLYK